MGRARGIHVPGFDQKLGERPLTQEEIDTGTILPFSPEFQQRQKELSRRRHTDVTRGEFEALEVEIKEIRAEINRVTGIADVI